MRRFTRLTNGFSKKVENHAYAVALHMMYYNFVRIHSKLRMSPAMAAGVSDRLWEIGDIVALVEASETKAVTKRGPYKKSAAQISNMTRYPGPSLRGQATSWEPRRWFSRARMPSA